LIDVSAGEAVFDFSGSGHEVYGNINAPKAVVLSALIYSLRCLVGQDIPLNQVHKKQFKSEIMDLKMYVMKNFRPKNELQVLKQKV
jgi:N-methylhydantoinase B/oxoprolinase/acetone carboxylase alpha subunit